MISDFFWLLLLLALLGFEIADALLGGIQIAKPMVANGRLDGLL